MTPLFMQPNVRVGLCENGGFGLSPQGPYNVQASEDSIVYTPVSPHSRMMVKGMTRGHNFHWQQKRDLLFRGTLIFRRGSTSSQLINVLPVEDYLESVISSEMSADAPDEYLKAHAVISRSWLMRILQKQAHDFPELPATEGEYISFTQNDLHSDFDVCADDHCQRYQGVSEAGERAINAVKATRGQVLIDTSGLIADCRFSKCCGGRTELFSAAWNDIDLPYLPAAPDPYCDPSALTAQEREALAACLKDYDSATDYYRWEEIVPKELISVNLKKYLNINLGEILELRPIETGYSGRIVKLEIRGTKGDIIIGKELTIRRILSTSHLKSSAFQVSPYPDGFMLTGRGWGHGVGLCQTGAAVMAIRGFKFEEILQHYYPTTKLASIYD